MMEWVFTPPCTFRQCKSTVRWSANSRPQMSHAGIGWGAIRKMADHCPICLSRRVMSAPVAKPKNAAAAKRLATIAANRKKREQAEREVRLQEARDAHRQLAREHAAREEARVRASIEWYTWTLERGIPLEERIRAACVPERVATELARYESRAGGPWEFLLYHGEFPVTIADAIAGLEACGATNVTHSRTEKREHGFGQLIHMHQLTFTWPGVA